MMWWMLMPWRLLVDRTSQWWAVSEFRCVAVVVDASSFISEFYLLCRRILLFWFHINLHISSSSFFFFFFFFFFHELRNPRHRRPSLLPTTDIESCRSLRSSSRFVFIHGHSLECLLWIPIDAWHCCLTSISSFAFVQRQTCFVERQMWNGIRHRPIDTRLLQEERRRWETLQNYQSRRRAPHSSTTKLHFTDRWTTSDRYQRVQALNSQFVISTRE